MKPRQYDQFCPVACALDMVGDRWAMLVIRELLLGPRRFADLEEGLPGIGTNTLATRLDELAEAGVIARRRLPPPAASSVYELTEWGQGLEPIIHAIARWGTPLLATATPKHPLRASWLAVALQAFFRSDPVRDLTTLVELVLPTGTLALHFKRGRLRVTDGASEVPAMRISATEQAILDLFGKRGGPDRRPPDIRVEGDQALLDRLIDAFPLGAAPA